MPRLIRRRLRCHYCGVYSPNDQPGIPRSWLCPHCEATNHLDERGEITDPPAEATAPARPRPLLFARSRSPTPIMSPPAESPFCDTCQRNQMLVQNLLAEYIPDDDDPEYDKYVASADDYRAELELRYPQVCDNCIGAVRDQIRAAGYAAKTDYLRRILESSKKRSTEFQTPRQIWTLRVIASAKWAYIFSILVGLVWHTLGLIMAPEAGVLGHEHVSWNVCLSQAVEVREVDQACFSSPFILKLVQRALVVDLLTIWWNPKLEQKTSRPGGRMRHLMSLWLIRSFVLALRFASLHYWQDGSLDNNDALRLFYRTHAAMSTVLVLSTLLSWNTVRIDYPSTSSFMNPEALRLPSAPNSSKQQTQYQPARPNHSTFDTMAQSFTSSFQVDQLTGDTQQNPDFPPSPTLTATSIATHDSDVSTPFFRKTRTLSEDNDMDWTPTTKRFSTRAPEIVPPMWSKPALPSQPAPKHQHSIFTKPDPNPFRHKVPPAPKPKFAGRQDPWKPGVWAPALPENKQNFFKDMMQSQGSPTARETLAKEVVPRRVKRDAELFQKPQLKYDDYGTQKVTGLEDTFNDLFST